MAELTRKRNGELLRGVMHVLRSHPDGYKAKDVFRELEKLVPPTEFEQGAYPKYPDVRRYERIVRFATIGAVKAGWLTKEKGSWWLTELGAKALEKHKDPEEMMREADRLYRQWKQTQPGQEETEVEEGSNAAATLEEAEETAWQELESHLGDMPPYDFQNLVAGLLIGMGYHVSWIAPPGPDRGIDIIASSDPLGVSGPRIKCQVKRRADKVDAKEIRSFLAMVAEGDVGVYISLGGFTKDADEEARYQEKRRCMLVDAKKFVELWIQNYQQIPEQFRRLMPLKSVYFLDNGE